MAHNETVCHGTGDRRSNYLEQIQHILNKLEAEECPPESCETDLQPLSAFEDYQARLTNKKNIEIPQITSLPIKETRRTSRLDQHLHENTKYMEWVAVDSLKNPHAPMNQPGRMKSFELQGGYVVSGCLCSKRDGLQDKCLLQGCKNKKLCMADPVPLCAPANATTDIELPKETLLHEPRLCCCNKPLTEKELPQNFQCYPCGL